MVCAHGVSKRFGAVERRRRRRPLRRARRVRRPARPERLRQDDAAAPDRRLRDARRRRDRLDGAPRRGHGHLGAAGAAPRRDGLPGLRALPAPDRRRERRLRPLAAGTRARAIADALELVGLGGYERPLPARALGRPAAARRPRPRARAGARRSSCSTSRGATSTRCGARRCATSSAGILRAADVTVAPRHARARGGVLARRPDRADAQRHDRPGRPARGALLRARRAAGAPSSSAPANFFRGRVAGGHVETAVGALPVANARSRSTTSRCSSGPSCSSFGPTRAARAEVVGPRVPRPRRLLPGPSSTTATTLVSQRPSTERVALGTRVPFGRTPIASPSSRKGHLQLCKVCLTLPGRYDVTDRRESV